MAKERIHTLVEPVQFGSETITQVTITRKLKHLRSCTLRAGADAKGEVSVSLDFGTLIDLGAKMIGHPVAVLEEFAEEGPVGRQSRRRTIFVQAPRDWAKAVTVAVKVMGIQPSEVWEFDLDDLTFWLERAEEWVSWQKSNTR
ncbi:hypothetical protein ACE0DR_06005 [Azotobacter sp. CWF10]